MEVSAGSNNEVVPATLGRYRILTRVAAGGMGTVYLAKTKQPDGSQLQVALKVLHAHLAQEEEVARRFIDEGRVGSRIAHPNVVAVHDAGQADGTSYLALEYVHGDTLSALLRASVNLRKQVPLGIATSILLDLLAGLHAAHEVVDEAGQSLGIVHRDVSPQNILVDLEGRAFISDFGVAKLKDSMRTTRSGTMIGKAGYMAPEQLTGSPVTARTDLYASGILLWECLAGRRLFSGVEDQIQSVVGQRRQPRIRSIRPAVSEELDELVAAMLEHDPSARPSSAFDISTRLRKAAPRASRSEVGAWVDQLVGLDLAERQRRADGEDEDEQTVARSMSSFGVDAYGDDTDPGPRSVLPPPNPPPRIARTSTRPSGPPSPHRQPIPEDGSTEVDSPALEAPPPSPLRTKTPPMIALEATRSALAQAAPATTPRAAAPARKPLYYALAALVVVALAVSLWAVLQREASPTAPRPPPTTSASVVGSAPLELPELPKLEAPAPAPAPAPTAHHPRRR